MTLTQELLGEASAIERIEEAATELYKALQAGRDTGTSVGITAVHVTNHNYHLFIRDGRHYGKVGRIPNPQCTIL